MANFNGTGGNDTIAGTSSNDTILGGAGNDTLDGDGGPDNLISNGDFGSGMSGWTVNNPTGGTAPGAIAGGAGFNSSNEAVYGDSIEQDFTPTTGVEHTISLTLSEFGIANADHTFQIDILDDAGNVVATETHTALNATSTDVSFTFIPTTGVSTLRITNTTSTGSTNTDGIVDNVVISETTPQAGDDSIDGGAGDDEITGNGGDDTLLGGDGADLIEGDGGQLQADGFNTVPGRTTVSGRFDDVLPDDMGSPNVSTAGGNITYTFVNATTVTVNVYYIDPNGDFVFNAPLVPAGGTRSQSYPEDARFAVVENGQVVGIFDGAVDGPTFDIGSYTETLSKPGDDSIDGGDGDDTIYGDGGDDSIDGGADNDVIEGNAGDDTVYGGTGNDHITGDSPFNDLTVTQVGTSGNIPNVMQPDNGSDVYANSGSNITYTISNSGSSNIEIYYIEPDGSLTYNTPVVPAGSTRTESYPEGAQFAVVEGEKIIAIINTNTAGDHFDAADPNFSVLEGHDVLDGGDGDDTIDGQAGEDFIDGGAGQDSIEGGEDDDTLLGDAGDDTIFGDTGDDDILGESGADSLFGGEGLDSIYGGTGNDTILGGDGADLIEGDGGQLQADGFNTVPGRTTISGRFDDVLPDDMGSPNVSTAGGNISYTFVNATTVTVDVYYIDPNGDFVFNAPAVPAGDTRSQSYPEDARFAVVENGQVVGIFDGAVDGPTFDIGSYTETLSKPGDDSIDGGDGDDTIYGDGGDDSIDGGADNDVIEGNAGDDTVYGGTGNDHITGDSPFNDLTVTQVGTSGNIPNVMQPDNGSDVYANSGSNITYTISNSGSSNIEIYYIEPDGSLTYNTPVVPAGSTRTESYPEGAQFAVVEGEKIIAIINTNTAGDHFDAADPNFSVLEGHDVLDGGDGDDTIDGQAGEDFIDGGAGQDSIEGGEDDDTLLGDAGDDTIFGDTGDDDILGESGADSLFGGTGADTILGGDGADSIDGGDDDDTIDGGADSDSLAGGGGDDLFVLSDGDDTISDFNVGNTGALNDGDSTNNDFVDLSGHYDNLSELYADQADDGILNQSNATDTRGYAVDYTDNTQFGANSLTLSGVSADISSLTVENTGVVCFASGTVIRTPYGDVPVEDLKIGDLILTADNGYRALDWIGSRKLGKDALLKQPKLMPIRIKANALAKGVPEQDLIVSPQHRIFLNSKIAECIFGEPEVLVAAKHLLQVDGVDYATDMEEVEYFHFLFDRHEIVCANGALAESLFTGPEAIKSLSDEARQEIFTIFPELSERDYRPRSPARPIASGRQARKLALRHQKNAKPLVQGV